ncbi:MAG: hypothetical protein KDD62_14465 [Bdellovibrionales bacterium]|nr:hypothetical protein [Bdellovibrionales bacterium]
MQVGATTHYSVPVEGVFNQHKQVARSALVYLASKNEAAVVIEPYPQFWPESDKSTKEFLNELIQLGKTSSVTAPITNFFFHRSFPVDGRHNAKIFREQLGEWADKQENEARRQVA